jgi:TRAP-type mannitol/chloroaromatic compound transport system substrate-binding protein
MQRSDGPRDAGEGCNARRACYAGCAGGDNKSDDRRKKAAQCGTQGGIRMTVSRRSFARIAAAGTAAAIASPAIAQTQPTFKWRLTSSFPKNLEGLFGAAQTISKYVSDMTDGKFELQVFAAGEIVPGLQVLDAVQNGTVECGHTYSGYYIGKNPALIFDGSLPFGLTPRQQNAWYLIGDGKKLIEELYDGFNVVAIPAGNTGGQTFGWFRKEIKTVADFNGVKMRVAGFGGRVLAKLGVVPQQIAGGDIYPALEKGTLDAAEWVGPHDDEKLGFHKVAKYMHIPGVLEMEANNSLIVNKASWSSLPANYQAILRGACAFALMEMLAKYDTLNARAINRVVAAGAQIVILPPDVLRALRGAIEQVLDEESAKSAQFKKVCDNWRSFRAEQHRWFSIADARTEMSVYGLTATQ